MPWPLSQDYNEAVQNPESSFADAELRGGEVATNALGLPMPCSGNFADVYRVNCPTSKRSWAVKCFTRQIPGLQERYQQISLHLAKGKPSFMVDFTFLDRGIQIRGDWYPILKMQWVEGLTLNQFVKHNLDRPQVLEVLCQLWPKLAVRLREANIAHCDLQHGNVLLVPASRAGALTVKLVDYDGMCVPALSLLRSIELGHPAYQHPQRLREGIYSLEVDRFSHLVIYMALRALMSGGKVLWHKYDDGDNLLFKPSDFAAPTKSALFYELLKSPNVEIHHLVEVMLQALSGPLDQVPLLEQFVAATQSGSPVAHAGPHSSAPAGIAGMKKGVGQDTPRPSPFDLNPMTEHRSGIAQAKRRTGVHRAPSSSKKRVLAIAVYVGGLLLTGLVGLWAGGLFRVPTRDAIAQLEKSSPGLPKATQSDRIGGKPSQLQPPPGPDPVVKTPPPPGPDPVIKTPPPRFTNTMGMNFALVPKGKSWLGGSGGKPGTQEVEIPHDFYLGVYDVTQGEWEELMGDNPSWFSRNGDGKVFVTEIADGDLKRFPVESVSWQDAQQFIAKLNAREKHVGWAYRLPTEAEWEYACRGGAIPKEESAFDFYFERPTNELSSAQANFDSSFLAGKAVKGQNLPRPAKVGSYQPNRLGIYDMHGNVRQWCEDSEGSARAFRGGGWQNFASFCRTAYRNWYTPSMRRHDLGFRVARVPVGKEIATIVPEEKTIPPMVGVKLPTKFTNSLGMNFALVPKGKSWLGGGGGKPGTQEVEIPHDFYLGVYDVTQGEWEALMGDNPSWFSRNGGGKDRVTDIADGDLKRFPVEMVTWLDAQRFIEKLNLQEKHVGWVYRLPTEAQWEYACRGGGISKDEREFDFYFERPTNDLSFSQANFDGNHPAGNAAKGQFLQRTAKVGSYRPNRLGIYDMHGNVFQWCADLAGPDRVIRGGGWGGRASSCRAAARDEYAPSDRYSNLGFRIARTSVAKETEEGVGKGPQAEARPGKVPQPEPGVGNKRVPVIPATDNKGPKNVAANVPSFEATDDQGKVWNSSDHVGKKIIVFYFYPAAFTGGCTKQACGFRDNFEDLTSKNVEVVAVSGDSAKTHGMFKKVYNLPFTLLADEKGSVAKKFGIATHIGGKVTFGGRELVRGVTIPRTTVIIGLDGKIAAKYAVTDAAGDSKKALEIVQSLQK